MHNDLDHCYLCDAEIGKTLSTLNRIPYYEHFICAKCNEERWTFLEGDQKGPVE